MQEEYKKIEGKLKRSQKMQELDKKNIDKLKREIDRLTKEIEVYREVGDITVLKSRIEELESLVEAQKKEL